MESDVTTDDFIDSLGTIFGVSELKTSSSASIGSPVLVAENAFVFFSWEVESMQSQSAS